MRRDCPLRIRGRARDCEKNRRTNMNSDTATANRLGIALLAEFECGLPRAGLHAYTPKGCPLSLRWSKKESGDGDPCLCKSCGSSKCITDQNQAVGAVPFYHSICYLLGPLGRATFKGRK